MNPYKPPKSLPKASAQVFGPVATTGVSFFAGIMSYYVYHYLSGIFGAWAWPPFLKSAARLYKPITIPAMDLLILGTPIVFAYVVVSYALFKVIRSNARGVLIAFCLGWLVPALVVVSFGEYKSPGIFFDSWSKWPHVAMLMFSPLIGVWLGFRLSFMRDRGAARAT